MMNCDQALEAISAELDHALTPEQQSELEAHLRTCPDCRSVRAALSDIDGALPQTQLEPPAALHDGVMQAIRAGQRKKELRRWVPAAVIGTAAAAALVLGGLGLIDMPGFSPDHRSTASLHEVVDTLFPSAQSDEHDSEAAREYAGEHNCAVLAIWGCEQLPELSGSNEKLPDGGWVYPVNAQTWQALMERYQDEYPMETYIPDAPAVSAVVLYP